MAPIKPFLGLSPRRLLYLVVLTGLAFVVLRRVKKAHPSDGSQVIPRDEQDADELVGLDAHIVEGMRQMEREFRVYVYDIEDHVEPDGTHPFYLHSRQCGISTGNNKGYGVEWYFVDQIRRSAFVTSDPAEADMFLIPVLPCRAKWEKLNPALSKEENHERGKAFSQAYVARAVGHIATTYPYYNGSRPHLTLRERSLYPYGADHFWFSTHDGGATRGQSAGEGFLKNTVALVNTADVAMDYTPCWHISLPCNCDFTRPPPRSEYNVLFSGAGRSHTVFFAGNLASNALRKAVYDEVMGDPFFNFVLGRMKDEDYVEALRSSTFCLHLRGFQVWSPRLIEYIWFGCVPVVLGDDYHLPYSAVFKWDEMSIQICEKDAGRIKEILYAVSPVKLAALRRRLRQVASSFIFNKEARFGDAFYMGMYELYLRHLYNVARTEQGSDFDRQRLCDHHMDSC